MKCPACESELKPAPTRTKLYDKKYCDVKCQLVAQRKERMTKFLAGEYVGRLLQYRTGEWTRDLLVEQFGYKCNSCGTTDWNGKPLTLEVNHIDGDALNNTIGNLEFLCANCHSQTPTFRALNKGCTRTSRRKILPA